MKKTLFALMSLAMGIAMGGEHIDLSGTWKVHLEAGEKSSRTSPEGMSFEHEMSLPGTTDEAGLGEKTKGSDFGILTREFKFYGFAWYEKNIEVPESWTGKRIFLELERVLWESRVYLDGKEVSVRDSLNSPHVHDLGMLSPGKHDLVIRVNNNLVHNIGDKGHSYTEYTQSIWNGVVGEIRLTAREKLRFTSPAIRTGISPVRIEIEDDLVNEGEEGEVMVSIRITEREGGKQVYFEERPVKFPLGTNKNRYEADLGDGIKLWDDENPNLYEVALEIRKGDKVLDSWKEEIGFREITASKSKLMVNGKPVFLRGNLDCVHFPLTGYPSCKVADWERIFRIYKDYGLNHVRFHSWCPPRAAFVAADRVGIYIQAETIWIDWWMTSAPKDRPEMWTKGLPQGLGKNPSADAFVQKELARMVDAYGNHASFAMMCIGNELGNSDFDIMETWLKPYRETDPRRLYSVATARRVMPLDQYMATHSYLGIGGTRGLRGGASTDWDFEDVYSQAPIPVIAHEIGQWPVYPRWSEIDKYTGVLKARNLEGFREMARKNHIEGQNEDFVRSSGALNQIMYKYEIESFLRTPSCAGIQLLSMQDYQGQGEALIGWLDVFYDSKGITTPKLFRQHSSPTVCLLRVPKFVWKQGEMFQGKLQLAHYGKEDLEDSIRWSIETETGEKLAEGETPGRRFSQGSAEIAGEIKMPLKGEKPARLTVKAELKKHGHPNEWNIWVFPGVGEMPSGDVHIAEQFDDEARKSLQEGGKVLLLASALGNDKTSDKMHFHPLYWSLTFFPGQGKNHLGLVVRNDHPAFGEFPTSFHSDWQWEKIYANARSFYLNDFPADYKPLAQPVDDFHRNNKLGAIFEMKVGQGKLLVCGFDLNSADNPVAGQLKKSLLDYMNSEDFSPSHEIGEPVLKEMFPYVPVAKNELPPGFESASFYVECAANLKETGVNVPWNKGVDRIIAKDGYGLSVSADGVWKDSEGQAWHGREMEVTVSCPPGVIGTLYVFLHDWNNNGRRGTLSFEGRQQILGRHDGKGIWVKFPAMREDTNDGRIVLKSKADSGPNLMISKMVFIEE